MTLTGHLIRERRLRLGLSQTELAVRVGREGPAGKAYVSRVEAGALSLSPEGLAVFERALGFAAAELYLLTTSAGHGARDARVKKPGVGTPGQSSREAV